MRNQHVGSVIITKSQGGKTFPTGIITDRDIALSLNSTQNPNNLLVEKVMSKNPITVENSEGIYKTAEIMLKNGIKRIPVVNNDGSLCGVVCSDDLLSLASEEINNLAKISETQINRD
jgi:signal-transduction protein with cAMP-binding, CBS, and nucleotidyltransferase domain